MAQSEPRNKSYQKSVERYEEHCAHKDPLAIEKNWSIFFVAGMSGVRLTKKAECFAISTRNVQLPYWWCEWIHWLLGDQGQESQRYQSWAPEEEKPQTHIGMRKDSEYNKHLHVIWGMCQSLPRF